MKELLKESGTTVKDLAKVLDVSHTTIHTYKKTGWYLKYLQKKALAKHLKMKVKDLSLVIDKHNEKIELILRENRKKK